MHPPLPLTLIQKTYLISLLPMNEGMDQKSRTGWRRRSLLLILLFLIAGIGSLVRLVMPPQEPSYQGEPLSVWLSRAVEKGLYQDDPEVIRCRDAIRAIGTNAVPTLLRILR